MNADALVELLAASTELTSLLAEYPEGTPAIYQIISPEEEIFPRLAVYEDDRSYTDYWDDEPHSETVRFQIDIFAQDNLLHKINTALGRVLRANGFARDSQAQDDYIEDVDVYIKSVFCSRTDKI